MSLELQLSKSQLWALTCSNIWIFYKGWKVCLDIATCMHACTAKGIVFAKIIVVQRVMQYRGISYYVMIDLMYRRIYIHQKRLIVAITFVTRFSTVHIVLQEPN